MRRLLYCIGGVLLSATAVADTVQDVMAILGRHALVRASYEQHKRVAGRKRELRSSGTLVFARNQGVLLEMNLPAVSQLVMTESTIVQRSAGQTTRLKLQQSPLGAAATVFGQLASGNLQQLQQNFAVSASSTSTTPWELKLTPRSEAVKKSLQEIRLGGDQFLQEITLIDTRGGRVLLQLADHQTQPETLSADESELFQLAH